MYGTLIGCRLREPCVLMLLLLSTRGSCRSHQDGLRTPDRRLSMYSSALRCGISSTLHRMQGEQVQQDPAGTKGGQVLPRFS